MKPEVLNDVSKVAYPSLVTNLERGFPPEQIVGFSQTIVEREGSHFLREQFIDSLPVTKLEAEKLYQVFRQGTAKAEGLSQEILAGKIFDWWKVDGYRQAMGNLLALTSRGQFVTVLGDYPVQRVAGIGPLMVVNHDQYFPERDGVFLDGLTNATVTNFGQGYPLHLLAANSINRITGGAQCVPYHPGPLMEQAAESLLSICPIEKEGARVAWFNSGGDAVSVAIAAAEKYTERVHGENGRRKAVYFKEAYHGNIEGRAGRATSGINMVFHEEDRNSIELEFPNQEVEVEPVLAQLKNLVAAKKISCVIFETTQGDGGGVSMHPDFFAKLVKLSLDSSVPLVVDEVQSGFGRSGRIFDVEHLLDYWKQSSYVKNDGYPEKPPLILAVAKSMTNGVAPGSAVIFPKEYDVLERAQGLNTYSAHPTTLAATLATINLMTPELLATVDHKRQIFENEISPYVGPDSLIKTVRGHGLHLFLEMEPNYNQPVQVELLGKRRVLIGTVARDSLRVHAPINAPDVVWIALAHAIGQTANEIKQGDISSTTLQILQAGPSGLAVR